MQTTTTATQGGITTTKAEGRSALSPLVIGLGALLALQLLLALGLEFGGRDMAPAASQGPLLAFDPEKVVGIRIQAAEGDPVLVKKTEKGWIIPALGDLPAAEHKVTGLLSKLQGLQKGLPVATSEEALTRFKVADGAFERKLTLEQSEGAPAMLYLGDSPGFRHLFVRAAEDSAVYDAELGLFDVPDKADDWSDRTLLHLDAEKIQTLTFSGLTLERKDDSWQIADLAAGEAQDKQAIEDKVRTLANIDFMGVLTQENGPKIAQDASPVEIEATLAGGETIRYQLSKLAEGNDYLLEVSNRPQRFTLSSYVAEELTGIKRADLLKKTEASTKIQETGEGVPTQPTEESAQAVETGETAVGSPAGQQPAAAAGDRASAPAHQTPPPSTTQVHNAVDTDAADPTATEKQTVAPVPEATETPNHH